MAPTMQEGKTRLYAGLYIRTRKQTRFWGLGSNGWGNKRWGSWRWGSWRWGSWRWGSWKSGSLRAAEVELPWAGLAEWLRLAHARLDHNAAALPAPADAQIEASAHGALQQDSGTVTRESKN